ncbi:hypothetical protein [Phytoactinopolyspora mesophila]|uniref:Uncharacterized protein n=1 Tax=Phytoactinopolyspora mesophila TaxID=2650750 RepID=A0A7K3M8B1_9ACTN|nr:hypothetical protein [Phytoactinopolyspora mesophila]NDL58648.1 hypothetical protein [Phytoactinopolyspora mesophila]
MTGRDDHWLWSSIGVGYQLYRQLVTGVVAGMDLGDVHPATLAGVDVDMITPWCVS